MCLKPTLKKIISLLDTISPFNFYNKQNTFFNAQFLTKNYFALGHLIHNQNEI